MLNKIYTENKNDSIVSVSEPLITIITVVFNAKKDIEKTIKSVINQTYKNIEYIIIDGGSTDGTIDIIKKYEANISYWISEKDKGIYDAMNKGIDLTNGAWINFMNAGDCLYNNDVIATIFREKISDNIKLIYGDVETDYNHFKYIHMAGPLSNLPKAMQFSHQSTIFASVYHKANKYNTQYSLSADYANIIGLYTSNESSFKYIQTVISTVSTLGVSETNILNSVIQRWKIVKSLKLNSVLLDIYYLTHIAKQYVKIFFFNDKLLSQYRRIKYEIKRNFQ